MNEDIHFIDLHQLKTKDQGNDEESEIQKKIRIFKNLLKI